MSGDGNDPEIDIEDAFFQGDHPPGRVEDEVTDRIPRAPGIGGPRPESGPVEAAMPPPVFGGPARPAVDEEDSLAFSIAVEVAPGGEPLGAAPGVPAEGSDAWSSVPATDLTSAGPAAPVAAPLPFAPPRSSQPPSPTPEVAASWQARIDALVKEARAQAGAPTAAPLWFEAGHIYETELGNLREAAGHYQEAHKADASFVPVIHAARRLFAQLGKWAMVVVLIDEEIKHATAAKAALLVEKGRIHETKLGRPDQAELHYKQALEADAGYAPAIDALSRHLSTKGDYAGVAGILEAAAAVASHPSQKVAWLVELGRLCEARLKDDAKALAALEEAHKLSPRRAVLEALRRLYGRTGNVEGLAEVLRQLAERARAPAEAVQFLLERSRLLSSGGDEHGAVETLEMARARAPSDLLVLGELVRLYEKLGESARLVDALEAQIAATQDRAERVALHAEAGRISEDALSDVERAIQHYNECVDEEPTYQPALAALGKLYARAERWHDLARVYDVQILAATDDSQRIPLLFKLAELRADKLDDTDGAIRHLLRVLEISPGYVPALKLVSSLYLAAGRWDDLVRMYETELEGQTDKDQAVFLLEKIGNICENQLKDPARAIAAYERMLARVPGYLPALRTLGRLYAQTERWNDLVGINTEESQIIGDQNHVVALLYRNGEIYAEKLGDADAAITAYKQALALMPNYLPALKSLGAIYARAGRWQDLVDMHRQEAEVARTDEQRAQLLCMIAEIHAEKLRDVEGATKAYREVLSEQPSYHPAIRALSRIAQQTGDYESLVDVYKSELAVLADARERGLMRCRMAELLDRYLGKPDEAAQLLEEAIKDASGLLAAHEQLVAIHARAGNAREESRARERMHDILPDTEGRIANLRVLGDLYLHRLDDTDKALKAYERLLAESPNDPSALRASMGCALLLRDYRSAIRHAETLSLVESHASDVANLHLQVAAWREGHLDPPEDPLKNYLKVLEYDPRNPTALRAAERAYVEREAWEGLFQLYELELKGAESPMQKADLYAKMGEIAERRLDRLELAAEQYEAALKVQPDHLPAIAHLKELCERLGRPEDQLRLLALEASTSKDPTHAIATLLEVGALQRDRFGNVDAAVQSFLAVLDKDPLHQEGFQAAEAMLVAHSRWGELAELYKRRGDATQETSHKTELLLRAAHLYAERLSQPERACDLYVEVLAIAPAHAVALAQLGALRFSLGQHEQAVEAYGRLVQSTGDAQLLAPAHHHLGVIFSDHLPDPARAVQHLTATLAAQPDNRDAQQRLALAYAQSGSPAQALQAHHLLFESATTTEEKLEHIVAVADLYENAFQDLSSAASQYDRALALTNDPAAQLKLLERAAGLYERAGDLDGYLNVALRHAGSITASDPARAAEILARNARLVLEHKKDADGAIRIARQGLDLAPGNLELRGFLADALSTRPNQFALAVEEHRKVLRSGVIRVPSIRALYRGWYANRAHDRSFVAAEVLSFLAAATEDEELSYSQHKKRVRPESEEALAPGEITSWIVHPSQRNVVHEILTIVATELSKLDADDLTPYGAIDKKDILKAKSPDALRKLADSVARNLGGVPFDIYRTHTKGHAVAAHHGPTPVLVVGGDVARSYQTREQRFLIGRKLTALRCGHHLVQKLDVAGFEVFLSAIGRAVEKSFPALRERDDLDALAKRIGGALSRNARKVLTEPLAQLADSAGRLDLKAFLEALPLTEARGGLVVSNAFQSACRLVARDRGLSLPNETDRLVPLMERDPVLADLVAYALSDEYLMARQRLRFAIDT